MAHKFAREVAQQVVQHSCQPQQVSTDLIDQFAAQVAVLEQALKNCKIPGQLGDDKAVGSSFPATPAAQTTGTPSAREATAAISTETPSAQSAAAHYLGSRTTPLLLPATQLPRELADGSPATVAVLYGQEIKCMEELAREQNVTSALASEVDTYRHKFEMLLAEQEVMHADFFIQRDVWERERRDLEDCISSHCERHETTNLDHREWDVKHQELNGEIASQAIALASVRLDLENHQVQTLREQNMWEQRLHEERQRRAEPLERNFREVFQRLRALEAGRAMNVDDARILQMMADVKAKSDEERELAEERARVQSLALELQNRVERDAVRTPALVAVACGASIADESSDSVVSRHAEAKSDVERELAEERARVQSLALELQNRVERDAMRTPALVAVACGASIADESSDSVVSRHAEAKSDVERELAEERARVQSLALELQNRVERDAVGTPALVAVACGASIADESSDSVVLRHAEAKSDVERELAEEPARVQSLALELQNRVERDAVRRPALVAVACGASIADESSDSVVLRHAEAVLHTQREEEQFHLVLRTQQEEFQLQQHVVSEDFEAREVALRNELSSKDELLRSTESELRAKIQSLKKRFSSRTEEIRVQTEAFKRAVASNEDDVDYHRSLAEQRATDVERLQSGLQTCQRHADELLAELLEQRQQCVRMESERDEHSEAAVRLKHKELQKLLIGKHQQLDKFKILVEQLKDQVVRFEEEKAQTDIEIKATRKSVTEMRKQARSQKEQLRHAKEQVMRLTEQLREQTRVNEEVEVRALKQAARTKELEGVLDEAGLQLVNRIEESQRAEEALRSEHRRAEEAEEALRAERSNVGASSEVQNLVHGDTRSQRAGSVSRRGRAP